jgi:rhodanese-related sulfurtransferase
VNELSAQEAHDLMQREPACIYLDVRSIPEFEQGHPIRAINIPLLHFAPGMGMVPNLEFVEVVEANLPKDARIVVGCKTGGRSAQACEILGQLGYLDVANIRTGFVGAMDNFGRITEPGWSLLKLPLCPGCGEDSHYDELAAKVKKQR